MQRDTQLPALRPDCNQFLFRLDDACPTWRKEAWLKIATIFKRYSVKPLVAVIPDNQDPTLFLEKPDAKFWEQILSWQAEGWSLGLHGYQHRFDSLKGGLIPINRYSEFAGHPLAEQKQRLREGYRLLLGYGLKPEFWVAPAHSFDRFTLMALESETAIRKISDGFAPRPFMRFGFLWIPQQLWSPKPRSALAQAVWTICLHPNSMQPKDFEQVEGFLQGQPQLADWQSDLLTMQAESYNIKTLIWQNSWLTLLRAKRLFKSLFR